MWCHPELLDMQNESAQCYKSISCDVLESIKTIMLLLYRTKISTCRMPLVAMLLMWVKNSVLTRPGTSNRPGAVGQATGPKRAPQSAGARPQCCHSHGAGGNVQPPSFNVNNQMQWGVPPKVIKRWQCKYILKDWVSAWKHLWP